MKVRRSHRYYTGAVFVCQFICVHWTYCIMPLDALCGILPIAFCVHWAYNVDIPSKYTNPTTHNKRRKHNEQEL